MTSFIASPMVPYFGFVATSIGTMALLWLLLNSAHTAPRLPLFPTPPPLTPSQLGVKKKLEEDTGGEGDLNWPKAHPKPFNVTLKYKLE